MRKHLIALKAHLDAVGEELYLQAQDPALRQRIGELAMAIHLKLNPTEEDQ